MYCYRCGKSLPDNSVSCPRCGNRLALSGGLKRGGSSRKSRKRISLIAVFAGLLVLAVIIALLFVFHVIPTSGNNDGAATPAFAKITAAPTRTSTADGVEPTPEETSAKETETAAASFETADNEYIDGVSNDELLDYFCDIALHVEYGDNDEILKRWEEPIRLQVTGDITKEDSETLEKHIDMLNSLGVLPEICIVESDANVFMYFIPLDEMDDTIPGYEPDNWGYFFLGWDWDYNAKEAYIGIATDVTTQKYRNHLILEEVTQALGLMDDSPEYKDSIFQVEWTDTQSLSDMDIALIKMLYCDELRPGMKLLEVRQLLCEWLSEN